MAKIVTKLFAPHSEIQKKIMLHLANRNTLTKTLWVACGTKFGKSCSSAGALAYAAPKFNNTLWRWVAPIAKQTKIGVRYIKKMWPPEPYTKHLIAENTILIPNKDIEIQFWHGQHPEDLEGEAVFGQVNDECSKLKEQVLISSRTTWTMTQAQRINISTPRGKNHFHKGCQNALNEMELAKLNNREPREIFLTAPTSANPYIPRASIEEAKRLLPIRLFKQYYEAEFIDDGSVFPQLEIEKSLWLESYEKKSEIDYWIHTDHANISIVAGCDWAKTQDYTVLTCWDYTQIPFKCRGFLRMQGKKYPEQITNIAKFLFKFKNCEIMYHDKTGIGSVIDDLLEKVPGLNYHGIVFSNASKAAMVNPLITAIELREIIFPWWTELIKEFESYEVETNKLGQMTYNAPDNMHDDIVTSCFLAYAACKQYATHDFEVKFLEDLPDAKFVNDTWENYIYESLDIDLDEGF